MYDDGPSLITADLIAAPATLGNVRDKTVTFFLRETPCVAQPCPLPNNQRSITNQWRSNNPSRPPLPSSASRNLSMSPSTPSLPTDHTPLSISSVHRLNSLSNLCARRSPPNGWKRPCGKSSIKEPEVINLLSLNMAPSLSRKSGRSANGSRRRKLASSVLYSVRRTHSLYSHVGIESFSMNGISF